MDDIDRTDNLFSGSLDGFISFTIPWSTGSSGESLSHIGPDLGLPHVKFIYPTAPIREVTVSNGARQNAWFDIAHPGATSSLPDIKV